jgi:tetratricopeptide (TPR) repeat protein
VAGLRLSVYSRDETSTSMKTLRLLQALLVACALMPLYTGAQGITTPRTASPGAVVSQKVGISTITVNYSRPSVKGREVWGKLVPYGWNKQGFGNNAEAPWRAGANENTTITLTNDAAIEGKNVPAGTYGLFFVINQDNSGEVILSKDTRSWGSFWYEAAHDQLRAPIKTRDIAHVEALTYDFINGDKNSTELVLNWEKKQFPVKITFAVDGIVMANATEELKGPVGFNWQGYASAANYALQNKTNTEQAMSWADQAVQQNKSFNTLNIKAGLLTASGKKSEGDALMKDAVTLANENELNLYGYQLLGQTNYDKAIEMLTLNTQRHPESANAWDSLGEAYALKGDTKNAVKHFKKSLTLNPAANIKANSEKYLKQLGAM